MYNENIENKKLKVSANPRFRKVRLPFQIRNNLILPHRRMENHLTDTSYPTVFHSFFYKKHEVRSDNMSRQTWKRDPLFISFSNPVITSFSDTDDSVKSVNDIMYFYYDVHILKGKKVLHKFSAYDFPKVLDLPNCIQHIMEFNMDKSYVLYEELNEEMGYYFKEQYAQVLLSDMLHQEYFYKIERHDYKTFQEGITELKEWTTYTVTIGQMERNSKSYTSSEFSNCIVLHELTSEELLGLKTTAERFIDQAIQGHNENPEYERRY